MGMKELKALYQQLEAMREGVLHLSVRGLPDGISSDTVFAIGEAAGVLGKAKALVGRDIDQAGRGASPESTLTRSGFR